MSFQPPYLIATKNLGPLLEALRRAQAPEKITLRFLEQLGFKSTNDRLFMPLLKAMNFVDEAGKPTGRYHSFLDDTAWQRVLADGVRDAYADLFRVNKNANSLPREQLTGKIKSLSEGKLSTAVVSNSVRTFLELVKLGDFSATSPAPTPAIPSETPEESPSLEVSVAAQPSAAGPAQAPAGAGASLVYRIEIVLPAVRDQAVYDAIFRSAREHLLK
jgi:hypothetical protein